MEVHVYLAFVVATAIMIALRGPQIATVFQDPILEGTLGLEYAARLAKGEPVDPVENHIDMQLVTAENVDKYLKN